MDVITNDGCSLYVVNSVAVEVESGAFDCVVHVWACRAKGMRMALSL